MVERRRLRRLKALTQKGGVVVQLRNGKTEVFSEHAPLALWALEVEEGMEAEKGIAPSEPTTPHGWEALRLKEALQNATSESRAEFYAKYASIWEEDSY